LGGITTSRGPGQTIAVASGSGPRLGRHGLNLRVWLHKVRERVLKVATTCRLGYQRWLPRGDGKCVEHRKFQPSVRLELALARDAAREYHPINRDCPTTMNTNS